MVIASLFRAAMMKVAFGGPVHKTVRDMLLSGEQDRNSWRQVTPTTVPPEERLSPQGRGWIDVASDQGHIGLGVAEKGKFVAVNRLSQARHTVCGHALRQGLHTRSNNTISVCCLSFTLAVDSHSHGGSLIRCSFRQATRTRAPRATRRFLTDRRKETSFISVHEL